MHKLILILPLFFGFLLLKENTSYRNIDYGDYLAITYGENQGEIDWDNAGNYLAFVLSEKNNKKVFCLNLSRLPITYAGKGFYSADYLNDVMSNKKIYIPLFCSQDTSFYSPKWNATGSNILSIGKTGDKNEIFITDKTSSFSKGTKIKNVIAAHWKNDTTFYVVYRNNPNELFETTLQNYKNKKIAETKFPIIGISKQDHTLLLTSKGGVTEFSTKSKKLRWFKLPIKGKTVWQLGELNFVGLNENGNAQVLDINSANTYPFCFGDNNGNPSISQDKKFVAFYSESFKGIIIKRIDKKFLNK